METRIQTNFYLNRADKPLVTTHEETSRSVSLHLGPRGGVGTGFCVEFLPCHLGVARRLVEALEAMKELEGEQDDEEQRCVKSN